MQSDKHRREVLGSAQRSSSLAAALFVHFAETAALSSHGAQSRARPWDGLWAVELELSSSTELKPPHIFTLSGKPLSSEMTGFSDAGCSAIS